MYDTYWFKLLLHCPPLYYSLQTPDHWALLLFADGGKGWRLEDIKLGVAGEEVLSVAGLGERVGAVVADVVVDVTGS
jgi:hypothetical protein